jgi:hypothetical protein
MAKVLQYKALVEPLHGLAVFVQEISSTISNQSSITLNIPNVGKCNALVIGVSLSVDPRASLAGAYPSDDKGDTFGPEIVAWDNINSTKSIIDWCFDAAGGSTNVTLSFGVNVTGEVFIYEIANANLLDYGGGLVESSNSTSHNSLPGAITTSTEGSFILCVGTSSANVVAFTGGSGFTEESINGDRSMFQRQVTTGALTTSGPYTTAASVTCATAFLSLRYGEGCGERNPIGMGWLPSLPQAPPPMVKPVLINQTVSPLLPIQSAVVPSMDWYVQQPGAPTTIKPAPQGGSVEPLEPTLFVKQNLGWLMQQPPAPPKTPRPGYTDVVAPVMTFAPISIGWYMQQPMQPPKIARPGYTEVVSPIGPITAAHVPIMVIWSDVSLGVPGFTSESITVPGFTGESLLS